MNQPNETMSEITNGVTKSNNGISKTFEKTAKESNNLDKSVTEANNDDETNPKDELRCGYFCWSPNCLQFFNSSRFLLVCVSWFTFTQGFVVNGIIYSNFTSLERRYGFSGTQLAWIASSYDAVAALFTVLFAYIGQWVHNGRILSIGAYFMALGSFLMTLPHFISGEYTLGPKPIKICELNENATLEDCSLSSSSYYEYFIIAQCLHAVGGAAVYSLAVPYMDGQIKTKNTPVYIGIAYGNAALGPAIGFILGGVFLSYYVDINLGIDPGITPSDPRWVGAWWIGMLSSGFAALTVGFFIGCFPRELPSAKKYKLERTSQAHKGKGPTDEKSVGKSFKDVLLAVKTLFKNSVWIVLTLATTIESVGVSGFGAFVPKIMQFQFALKPTTASLYSGFVIVPGAAGGYIIGGLIAKCFKSQMRGLVIQSLVCSVIGLFLSAQFLIRCETVSVSGVTVPYHNSTVEQVHDVSAVNVIHQCNSACNCTTESYDPVCGSDNIEYFTPCHAGCLGSYVTKIDGSSRVIYTNCTCINPAMPSPGTSATGIGGLCTTDCTAVGWFLALLLLLNLCTFISSTSAHAATIRCVPDTQRGFAYGIQQVIVRVLGSVPGPLILGAMFDYACLLHQEVCDITGSCWIYDTDFISIAMLVACACIKFLSTVCFILILILYKPPTQDAIVTDVNGNNKLDESKARSKTDGGDFTHM